MITLVLAATGASLTAALRVSIGMAAVNRRLRRLLRQLDTTATAAAQDAEYGHVGVLVPLPHGWQSPPRTSTAAEHYKLSDEQKYQFDLNGFFVLKQHYDAAAVAEFHEGIDELQAVPVEHAEYCRCVCFAVCFAAGV